MNAAQGLEVEKKYDAGKDATVPPLEGIPGVARVGEPRTAQLEAVYFDTEKHALAGRRITLRRRTGGADAGWHLKLPPEAPAPESGPQQRRELHAPLGQPGVVPDSLLAYVQAYLRGAQLNPVVRLETERTTYPLYGDDGVHLADLADDRVTAEALPAADPAEGAGDGANAAGATTGTAAGDAGRQQWREWELELVHGEPALFGPAEEVLLAAGARPAGHASKLAKALGGGKGRSAGKSRPAVAPAKADGQPGPLAGKKAPAAAVVTVFMARQIELLLTNDAGVRLEEPDAVHDMRSAARRLRSVLSAYRDLYLATPVRRLRDELTWLGEVLGEPRDAEVLRANLLAQLAELPPGHGTDAVRERLERQAGATFDAGYRRLQEALKTDRYYRLLDSLEEFRDSPPVRATPVATGRAVTSKAVDKAAKRLRRSHKAAVRARRGNDQETALHKVRKNAKRLRHVAESAAIVKGKRAGKIAKAAQRQQKILGTYHDAVLARDLLSTMASERDRPATAEAYAALVRRQEELMAAMQKKYGKARKKSQGLLRRGVV